MSSSKSTDKEQRPVFFFDVDDCLYPRSLGVPQMMYRNIINFVTKELSLSEDEAITLIQDYSDSHILAVIGLHKFHQIDPIEFNEQNDNALPMDSILSPDEELRATLLKFDPAKVKLWLFTNAYETHARKVVRLLGIDDLFEGITYCDYTNGIWPLKPHREMFEKAEKDAGVSDSSQCYFVDDSPRNCDAALSQGWQVVRISDEEVVEEDVLVKKSYRIINSLNELHDLFPHFSKR